MSFGIVLENLQKDVNLGTCMRNAYNFDANFIAVIGKKYRRHCSDTVNAILHAPLFQFLTWDEYFKHCPSWEHIGIEITKDSHVLYNIVHPQHATYVFGPENGSISKKTKSRCRYIASIPSRQCLNLAVTTGIVMYDRKSKE